MLASWWIVCLRFYSLVITNLAFRSSYHLNDAIFCLGTLSALLHFYTGMHWLIWESLLDLIKKGSGLADSASCLILLITLFGWISYINFCYCFSFEKLNFGIDNSVYFLHVVVYTGGFMTEMCYLNVICLTVVDLNGRGLYCLWLNLGFIFESI